MSKTKMFATPLLLILSVFSLAWSPLSAAPADDLAAQALTLGPNENVSQTDEMSEVPQVVAYGNSLRAIWGERNFDAVVVSEKTIGGSWSPRVYFEEGAKTGQQWADITVTPDGTTHIAYATGVTIYHRSKANGSTTWSGRNVIAVDDFPNPVRMAAAPDGSIWAVWRNGPGSAIQYRRSTNGGATWQGGTVAAQPGNMFAPDIDVGPDNIPHVSWYIRAGTSNGNTAWIADWNGSSWNLSTIGNRGGYVADPDVAVDNQNTVHIAYRRQNADNWTIQHATRAAGQGWSGSNDVASTRGDAAYSPGLAVDPLGGVHVSYSSLNGNGRDVFYAYKVRNGSFSAPVNVSENSNGWNSRSTVVTTFQNGQVTAHVVYQRGLRGQDVDEIYARSITEAEPCGTPKPQTTVPSLPFKVYLPLFVRSC